MRVLKTWKRGRLSPGSTACWPTRGSTRRLRGQTHDADPDVTCGRLADVNVQKLLGWKQSSHWSQLGWLGALFATKYQFEGNDSVVIKNFTDIWIHCWKSANSHHEPKVNTNSVWIHRHSSCTSIRPCSSQCSIQLWGFEAIQFRPIQIACYPILHYDIAIFTMCSVVLSGHSMPRVFRNHDYCQSRNLYK